VGEANVDAKEFPALSMGKARTESGCRGEGTIRAGSNIVLVHLGVGEGGGTAGRGMVGGGAVGTVR